MADATATTAVSYTTDWVIFVVVYVGVAIGTFPFTRLNRAAIALLGAIAVVATGRLTFDGAIWFIDWTTLALLFSLMMVAASLRVAGFYTRVIALIVAEAGNPWKLLIGVVVTSAVLSAVFANDIICLAFTPVLCAGLLRANRKPLPYLIALATASNIGSAATIIGNPQNMLIGQSAHLSFANFTMLLSPVVLLALVIDILVVAFVYRKTLFSPPAMLVPPLSPTDLAADAAEPFRPWHVAKTLIITAGLVGAFLFTGVPREIAALVAVGLVMISRTQDPRKLFALVDWELILLFIGLFVVIGNVQQHGLLTGAMSRMKDAGISLYSPWTFAGVTVVLSNLVSNVPSVLLLKPGLAIPTSPADPVTHLWYQLAIVSTFAGNLTLLGSIANLIVAEQAKRLGIHISFAEYLKVGVVLTLLTVLLALLYFTCVL